MEESAECHTAMWEAFEFSVSKIEDDYHADHHNDALKRIGYDDGFQSTPRGIESSDDHQQNDKAPSCARCHFDQSGE